MKAAQIGFASVILIGCLVILWGQQDSSVTHVDPLDLPAGATFFRRSSAKPEPIQIHTVLFDERRIVMRVIQQPDVETARSLPELLQNAGAFAGCNGGYFALKDFGVYGLQICDGLAMGVVGNVSDREAALLVRHGTMEITRARGLTNEASITQMVQCNPMLIEKGVSVINDDDERRLPRTFIATDGKGRWVFGCSDGATLSGLARLLADGEILPELKIVTAMNLDGGPSSGLWCASSAGAIREFNPSTKTMVKNCLALFPRDHAAPPHQ